MTDKTEAYVLQKVTIQPEFMATAALLCCQICGETIEGMGGPGNHICIKCGDDIKSGKLRARMTIRP